MEHTGRWLVTSDETSGKKLRLDQYLSAKLPGESRSRVQVWIRREHVEVNGAATKTGHLLRPGDQITLHAPAEPEALPSAEPIPLAIVYADPDLAVVDKPAGLVTHLGAGVRSGTLVNALLYHLGPLEGGEPSRPGIVHRLDKLTSGLLVVARNAAAHRALAAQFRARSVHKEYVALVHGVPRASAGTIDVAIGRDPKNRRRISPRASRRRSAVTHYSVERLVGAFALLRLRIETGRTHQIRVHLAHIGHPVVGDDLYGGGRGGALGSSRAARACGLQRFFLHAVRLEIRHPRTGELMRFESPLPPELDRFLNICNEAAGAG